MINAKQGGTRANSAVSQNGAISVLSSNGPTHDGRGYSRAVAFRSQLPVSNSNPSRIANTPCRSASKQRNVTSNEISGSQANGHQDVGAIVKSIFEAESEALAQIPRNLETGPLELAASALLRARRICCYANGSSRLVASEAEYQFVRLGLHCIFIQDWMQLAIQTALYSSEDVVLAFSPSGRERRTVQGLALARRTGATTISVTSEAGSRLAKQSQIALVLPERAIRPHRDAPRSKIPELMLIDALATYIASRTSKPVNSTSRCDELIEKMLVD
jgi:DNA-binding MurR/RpiR family transcriptional regulator